MFVNNVAYYTKDIRILDVQATQHKVLKLCRVVRSTLKLSHLLWVNDLFERGEACIFNFKILEGET